MEGTYILGNNNPFEEVDGTYIEIPELINEMEIHNWIVNLFNNNSILKIIILIDTNPLLDLQIGYHIRLSLEVLKEKALVPIMYISKTSLNNIILQTEIYSQILATKGVVFAEFDLPANRAEMEILESLPESDFLTKFLKIVKIQPDEKIGRHSLANIWGAYTMDKASSANALPKDADFKKNLYFKYISAFNNLEKLKPSRLNILDQINLDRTKHIDAKGKKILYIDDQAEDGWEEVMRKIFKTDLPVDFVVINEKVKDFESFSDESRNIIETQEFDLYLVDLRLNGSEEDENLNPEMFSGMNVIKKIKSINQGNQIIVFTASNKVWNLKALFKAGATDYYLKESPEYSFSKTISEDNYEDFRNNVNDCFNRSDLRYLFKEWNNSKIQNTNSDVDFIAESETALLIAWTQIENYHWQFAYLTLFQIIENYANKLYIEERYEDTLIDVLTIDKTDQFNYEWLLTYNKDSINGDYFSSIKNTQRSDIKVTTLYKVSCLLKIKYGKNDSFLKEIGYLNSKRNQIAHKVSGTVVRKENLSKILKIISEIRNN